MLFPPVLSCSRAFKIVTLGNYWKVQVARESCKIQRLIPTCGNVFLFSAHEIPGVGALLLLCFPEPEGVFIFATQLNLIETPLGLLEGPSI